MSNLQAPAEERQSKLRLLWGQKSLLKTEPLARITTDKAAPRYGSLYDFKAAVAAGVQKSQRTESLIEVDTTAW